MESIGRLNIAYADGHVALRSNDELADYHTGVSTLDSWWSPLDPQVNRGIGSPGD
jgi:prepilin-type processing-associated H-X9-DG protein